MSTKKRVKRWVEKRFGLRMYQKHHLPHGASFRNDLDRLGITPRMVFDVGANVGQTARRYAHFWPEARIHSFEPVSETFEELTQNTASFENIRCHQIALGDKEQERDIRLRPKSVHNSLVSNPDVREVDESRERVQITTLARFCSKGNIRHIDLLKIDTEGFDLHVIEGARSMLESEQIDAVFSEVGFDGDTRHWVPFEATRDDLSSVGYRFAGLYDQFMFKYPRIRWANALFVRETLWPRRS